MQHFCSSLEKFAQPEEKDTSYAPEKRIFTTDGTFDFSRISGEKRRPERWDIFWMVHKFT